jgi:nucleoside-diphosphate-sugar epimerase
MQVMVTGARGFLGSAVVATLREFGHTVISAVHKRSAGDADAVELDLCDLRLAERLKTLPAIDAIVHLAARIGWDGYEGTQLLRPNVIATADLAAWAAERGIYMLFSSAAIVCGVGRTHISPSTPVVPDTDYARSKLIAEDCIRLSGVSHASLRLGGIYGLGGPAHLGLNRSIDSVSRGEQPLLKGSGSALRNYVYVKDAADVVRRCVEQKVFGIHYVGGPAAVSIAAMLETLCSVFLSGSRPLMEPGSEASNQIVDRSPVFPGGTAFEDAVKDMKHDSD